jgi:predicted alpha/beta superfamily hydrolase
MKTLCALLVCSLALPVLARQAASVDSFQGLVEIHQHSIDSEIIGKRYEIMVGLPASYAESPDRHYPTIYITDGAALFPMLQSYYRYLYFAEDVPELILVAISYSDGDWVNESDRGHDYTAPAANHDYYGGADDFQAMLRQELIPTVEAEYRSRSDRRIVFGQSIGGQFVMYTAHTDPGLFWGHIASNPALHRNVEFFLPDQTESRARPATNLFVLSAADDDPRFRQPAMQWIDEWAAEPKKPWRLHVEGLAGHNHFSPAPAAFRLGMKWLFSSATIPRPTGD